MKILFSPREGLFHLVEPTYIIFQLLRFSESNGVFKKNAEPIVCEEVLKISIDAGNGTFCSRKYALKAVVNHNGTLSNGHYTAIVKDKS